MDLHQIVAEFRKLGYVSLGEGPKHPEGNPNVQLAIDQFLAMYPTIALDQSFVDFLEYYSAAAIDWPQEQLTIEIYGFSSDVTLEIARPEEPLQDENGFYRFAEILVKPGPNGEKAIDGLYAFDVTGTRRNGIYQRISLWSENTASISYQWYCQTFAEWLARVVEAGGRLPLVSYSP